MAVFYRWRLLLGDKISETAALINLPFFSGTQTKVRGGERDSRRAWPGRNCWD